MPLWNGEYGLFGEGYDRSQIDRFRKNGIAGQALWSWKGPTVDYALTYRRTHPAEPYTFDVETGPPDSYKWIDLIRYLTAVPGATIKPTPTQASTAIAQFLAHIPFASTTPNNKMLSCMLKYGSGVNTRPCWATPA